ncbi:MAG TPA: S41 family peptidase [Gemmatimonadales bacterium]|nr:S41 family peptidase [Gemmatimonadales bacterium]
MLKRLGALVFVAVLSFLSGGWLLHREPTADGNLYEQARILETVLSVIHDHALVAPPQGELFQNAARNLVSQLKDPYAELLVGDGYRQFNRQMSGTGEVLPTAPRAPGEDAPVHVPAISPSLLLTPTVGYAALHSLSEGAADELAAAVWNLRKQGMRSLVLDLRNNPGGLIREGVRVSQLFLNKGDTVATTRGRTSAHTKTYVADAAQRWPGLNVVVLVNDGTASSAELIAGALQDHDRAAVIGQPTYGKGVLQTTYPLGNEMAIKLTTARWFTPSGRSVNRPRTASDSAAEQQRLGALSRGVQFRTDGGRPLAEANGIVPDLLVKRDSYTAGERRFLDSLGNNYGVFRKALEETAAKVKAEGTITQENFAVTAAMREAVRAALATRGVRLQPATFDGAATYVDRQLSYEIARAVFGDAAANRRRLLDDRQLRMALDLVQQAPTQPDLIRYAEQATE